MLHCPVIKLCCPLLYTLKLRFVSDWVTGANPLFFIYFYNILNYRTGLIIPVLNTFIEKTAQNDTFLSPFCKNFSLPGFRNNVSELTVNQISTVRHNSIQNSCTQKKLILLVCIFLEEEKSNSERYHKKHYPLIIQILVCKLKVYNNADHAASKVNKVEKGRQNKFQIKAKSSPLTWPRKMKLVFVQLCNNSQGIYHNVIALLPQHHIILPVV